MDLVKKKTIALDLDTYERLSKLAAQLRVDNPGVGFVSMGTAVWVLLSLHDKWQDEIKTLPIFKNETK